MGLDFLLHLFRLFTKSHLSGTLDTLDTLDTLRLKVPLPISPLRNLEPLGAVIVPETISEQVHVKCTAISQSRQAPGSGFLL